MEEKMTHHCEVSVINCMDFRLQTGIYEFLVSLGYKNNFDLISNAGSLKDLVEGDESESKKLLKDINVSYELHKVRKFIIIHHMDCGAYGGHDAFDGLEDEKIKQIEAMKKAAKIIKAKYSDVEIQMYLARIGESDDEPKVDFEIVQ